MGIKKLKLFIWREIRPSYSNGIAFALAYTVEGARKAIKNNSDDWEWERYADELNDNYEVHDKPYGYWEGGGD